MKVELLAADDVLNREGHRAFNSIAAVVRSCQHRLIMAPHKPRCIVQGLIQDDAKWVCIVGMIKGSEFWRSESREPRNQCCNVQGDWPCGQKPVNACVWVIFMVLES
jgi:hypothetical protein